MTDTVLKMHANTFRGLRVELHQFFLTKKSQMLTKEIAFKIKEAMKELSTKAAAKTVEDSVLWLNLEKY